MFTYQYEILQDGPLYKYITVYQIDSLGLYSEIFRGLSVPDEMENPDGTFSKTNETWQKNYAISMLSDNYRGIENMKPKTEGVKYAYRIEYITEYKYITVFNKGKVIIYYGDEFSVSTADRVLIDRAVKDLQGTENGIDVLWTQYNKNGESENENTQYTTTNSVNANTGKTFNSPSTDQLEEQVKKSQENVDNIREKPTVNIDIKKYFLTERQIAKKLLMMQSPGMDEERAQLIVYGKLNDIKPVLPTDSIGKIFDNDKREPTCVSQPTDENYEEQERPLDENSPMWKDIEKKKKEVIDSVKELGVKAKELIVAEIQCMIEIVSSLISIASSAVIMPPGSGLPVAFASLQTMISSIKRLQAKTGEIAPLFAPLQYIALLLPASAAAIVALIAAVMTVINTTLSLVAGVMSALGKASESLPKELPTQELTIKPEATKTTIVKGEITTLKAGATGGDWQYTYEWTTEPPSGFNSKEKEPTVNPMNTTKYLVKVTDKSGSSKNSDITIIVLI